MNNKKTEHLHIVLTIEQKEIIRKAAFINRVSIGKLIRMMIDDFISKFKE